MKTKNLPAYILKHVRMRHMKDTVLTLSDLTQLSTESPHQPVREFAKWKLRKVGTIFEN
jgi:hypothetical protein